MPKLSKKHFVPTRFITDDPKGLRNVKVLNDMKKKPTLPNKLRPRTEANGTFYTPSTKQIVGKINQLIDYITYLEERIKKLEEN